MNKVELIEQYILKHIDKLDFIIEEVLFLLPDSYFYKPEINQGVLLDMRDELENLAKKKKFPAFRNDRNVDYQYKKLYSKYNASLAALAVKKRQSLKDELLSETDEMKIACLISLISSYKLLHRLRTYE